jgi:hypothetical protein
MRTGSTTSNSASSTTRTPSTNLPLATHSTTARSPTSTSQLVMDSIKRRNGFDSMMMVPSQTIMRHRGPTSNPTLSTCMQRLTSALTLPSKHCQIGLGICSLDWDATFRSYSRLWLTWTGVWPVKLHATVSSMMMSQPLPSKSNSTNIISTPPEHGSHHVSPTSCSPTLPNGSPHYKTYLGMLEQYVWDGRGVVACHTESMFAPHRWKTSRDVHGRPS